MSDVLIAKRLLEGKPLCNVCSFGGTWSHTDKPICELYVAGQMNMSDFIKVYSGEYCKKFELKEDWENIKIDVEKFIKERFKREE